LDLLIKQTYAESNWNGTVLAESDRTEVVDNNHYFQLMPSTANTSKTATRTQLVPGRSVASYYNIEVDGQ